MNRSNLDSIRSNIGVGQGAVRNADTRSKDMATFNYQAPVGTKPLQTGGYTTPGANGVSWNNPGMQAPTTPSGGGYVRPQFQNGMSAQAFNNSYNTFSQNAAGIPQGMNYSQWMRSGQFYRPANPFQRPTTPAVSTHPNPYQTDPFQSGGGNDIKPGPGKPSQQMNPPGNSGVTRPPRYVQPVFTAPSKVGGP